MDHHMQRLQRETRNSFLWSAGGAVILFSALITVVLVFRPTPEERFDRCMGLAERGGLLDARREDAALICLRAVMTRRGSRGSSEDGPGIGMTTNGTPVIIP